MRILLNGACGRMGLMFLERAADKGPDYAVVGKADPCLTPDEAAGNYRSLSDCGAEADVVVDFSHHSAARELAALCLDRKLPLVMATTGHTEEEKRILREASASVPVFCAPNMSLGVAVLADLAKRAAAAFPEADIEIVETHHNQKLDVPSGTALMLAETLRAGREAEAPLVIGRHENGRRRPGEIGVHALRLGSEVGTHEIHISTGTETLTLCHRAHSRALFADGALAAAEFLARQGPGMYTMRDLIAE